MKKLTLLFAGLIGLGLNAAFAADAPHGSLLELHSCEVYAGPCVVSSESPQEGRYMARAWDFTGGSFHEPTSPDCKSPSCRIRRIIWPKLIPNPAARSFICRRTRRNPSAMPCSPG